MDTHAEVLSRLQIVFRDVFDDERIVLRPETTAADIAAWNSLMHISVIVGIEESFCIRLKSREINSLQTVGDMVDHICRVLQKRGGR